jgi:hypothetical protein
MRFEIVGIEEIAGTPTFASRSSAFFTDWSNSSATRPAPMPASKAAASIISNANRSCGEEGEPGSEAAESSRVVGALSCD